MDKWDKLYGTDVPERPKQEIPELPTDIDDITELCKLASKEAVRVLYRLMMDSTVSPGIRKQCAEAITDRGFGRPHQAVEHTGNITHQTFVIECAPPKLIEGDVIEIKTS